MGGTLCSGMGGTLWTGIYTKTLSNYSMSDTNAKTAKRQEVANLLASVNKKQFIDGLITIVKGSQNIEQLTEIAELINIMPIDNVPYFLTLIRFQYAVENKKP